jgi:hypothetical protein
MSVSVDAVLNIQVSGINGLTSLLSLFSKKTTPHNNFNYMTRCGAHDNGSYSNTIAIVKVTHFSFQIENKIDRKHFKVH